jgi:hypothetical protein
MDYIEKRLGLSREVQQKFKDGVIEIVGLLNQNLGTAPFDLRHFEGKR